MIVMDLPNIFDIANDPGSGKQHYIIIKNLYWCNFISSMCTCSSVSTAVKECSDNIYTVYNHVPCISSYYNVIS